MVDGTLLGVMLDYYDNIVSQQAQIYLKCLSYTFFKIESQVPLALINNGNLVSKRLSP